MEVAVLFVFVFGILGAVFTAVGIGLWLGRRWRLRRCTCETVATVIDNQYERSHYVSNSFTSGTWHPIVRYYAEGHTYERRLAVGRMGKPRYEIGEKLLLLYDPDDPDYVLLPEDNTVRVLIAVFLFIGLPFTVTAALAGAALLM